MIEFDIKFTKTGNFFHFISNLTEWHFSCRPVYNRIWLEKTGPLSDKEKQALDQLKTLLNKYNLSSGTTGPGQLGKFLGIPFTICDEESVWQKVENWVEPEEFKILKEIFKTLTPRFEKIWIKEEPKLINWKKSLEDEISQKKYDDLENDLKVFFNQTQKDENIDIYLLINASGSGGGANIGPGRITVECTALPVEAIFEVVGTLYHEAAHRTFGSEYYHKLLEQFVESKGNEFSEKHALFESGRGLRSLLNEAVVGSLLPGGYLTSKYFGSDILNGIEKLLGKNFENVVKGNRDDYRAYIHFAKAKLYPTAKDYVENKKPVDEKYLQTVWEVFEDFERRVS